MCTGAELFLIGAGTFSALSSIQQGREEKQALDYQAAQADADAAAERGAAQVRAQKARKAGRSQQSEARAALSASGVEVGAGTALKIEQEIVRSAEEDALQEILFGTRKGQRLEQQAGLAREAGDQAKARGRREAFSSLLSTGATVAGGWGKPKVGQGYGFGADGRGAFDANL